MILVNLFVYLVCVTFCLVSLALGVLGLVCAYGTPWTFCLTFIIRILSSLWYQCKIVLFHVSLSVLSSY